MIRTASRLTADEVEHHGLDPKRHWRLVLAFTHDDFGGVIVEDYDGVALSWTDFVANTWVELYSMLPAALTRYALLLHAAHGADLWFKTADPLEFSQTAIQFLDEQLVQG